MVEQQQICCVNGLLKRMFTHHSSFKFESMYEILVNKCNNKVKRALKGYLTVLKEMNTICFADVWIPRWSANTRVPLHYFTYKEDSSKFQVRRVPNVEIIISHHSAI